MLKTKDWRQAASFNGTYWTWARRARVASHMLGNARWVCDIGCGEQPLRWFLPSGNIYLPADIVARTPEVEQCDLDAGKLPLRSLAVCEVAVMLGVLTHLDYPGEALAAIAEHAETLLISYNVSDLKSSRPEFWRNAFTREDLTGLLTECGFIATAGRRYGTQVILKARSRRFDDRARTRRALAQTAFEPPAQNTPHSLVRAYHFLRTAGCAKG